MKESILFMAKQSGNIDPDVSTACSCMWVELHGGGGACGYSGTLVCFRALLKTWIWKMA